MISFDNATISTNFPQHHFDWKIEEQGILGGYWGSGGIFTMTTSVDIQNSNSEFITGVVGVSYDNDYSSGFAI